MLRDEGLKNHTENMRKIVLRGAVAADYPAILDMNEESVHFLSPMDLERLQMLHRQSEQLWVAEVNGEVAAFVLTLTEGKDYDSVNYQWFSDHYPAFLYIDRVVVAQKHQGSGLGKALYQAVLAHAEAVGTPCITAEIDINPPNPGSLAFHEGFGFQEVGRQSVAGGKKVVSLQRLIVG